MYLEPGKESFDYFINLFRPVALRMETASKERQRRLITGKILKEQATDENIFLPSFMMF